MKKETGIEVCVIGGASHGFAHNVIDIMAQSSERGIVITENEKKDPLKNEISTPITNPYPPDFFKERSKQLKKTKVIWRKGKKRII